jgi:hypothetical protein
MEYTDAQTSPTPDASLSGDDASLSDDVVLETAQLGFPWVTVDPFIFTVHHHDRFPVATAEMGPATTEGRRDVGCRPVDPGVEHVLRGRRARVPGAPAPWLRDHHHHPAGHHRPLRLPRGDGSVRRGRRPVVDRRCGDPARRDVPAPGPDGPNTSEIFQIWLNLPAADKMVEPYFTMFWREDIPRTVLKDDNGRHRSDRGGGRLRGHPTPGPSPRVLGRQGGGRSGHLAVRGRAGVGVDRAGRRRQRDRPHALRLRGIGDGRGPEPRGTRGGHAPTGHRGRALGRDRRAVGPPPPGPAHRRAGGHGRSVRHEHQGGDRRGLPRLRQTGFGGWPWATSDPVHPRSTPRFAHHPDGRTEYPEGDDR